MRKKHRNRRRSARHVPGQKPRGCFQERVKQVGPEHFAIIPVDCGKQEGRTRVADFYGNVFRAHSRTDTSCTHPTVLKPHALRLGATDSWIHRMVLPPYFSRQM